MVSASSASDPSGGAGSAFFYQSAEIVGYPVSGVDRDFRRYPDLVGSRGSGNPGLPFVRNGTVPSISVLYSGVYRTALVFLFAASDSLEQAEDNLYSTYDVTGDYYRTVCKSCPGETVPDCALAARDISTENAMTDISS